MKNKMLSLVIIISICFLNACGNKNVDEKEKELAKTKYMHISIKPISIFEFTNEDSTKVFELQTGILSTRHLDVSITKIYTEIYIEDSTEKHQNLIRTINWNHQAFNLYDNYPFGMSERITNDIIEGEYINFLLYVSYIEDGVKFEDVLIDHHSESIVNIPLLPETAEVDEVIELPEQEAKYKIYESAWQWIEVEPKYIEARIPSGKYKVTHIYSYEGQKYINLDGIGWIIIETFEKEFNVDVSFNEFQKDRYLKSVKQFKTSVYFEGTEVYKYNSIKIDVFFSNEINKYQVDEFITSCYSDSIEGVEQKYNTALDISCNLDNPNGKYLNMKLYLTYEKDGKVFTDILVDQKSSYYK